LGGKGGEKGAWGAVSHERRKGEKGERSPSLIILKGVVLMLPMRRFRSSSGEEKGSLLTRRGFRRSLIEKKKKLGERSLPREREGGGPLLYLKENIEGSFLRRKEEKERDSFTPLARRRKRGEEVNYDLLPFSKKKRRSSTLL